MKVPRLGPIAHGVWLLRGGLLRNMNAYLIEGDGQVVVYDTGEKRMAAAAARLGGIRQVVLGHADTDHRGSAPALSKAAPVKISGTVAPGERVAGFEVVEPAGHAPGMIGLWRESDRVALVSDTVYLTTMPGRPTAARESVRRLAALRPRIVGVGHLGPMTGPDVVAELEAAAR